MADDTTFSSDPDGLRQAAEAFAAEREAELNRRAEYGPPPAEQEPQPEEPVEKVPDFDDTPISVRRAGELLDDLRRNEETRRQNYAQQEADDLAAAKAAAQAQQARPTQPETVQAQQQLDGRLAQLVQHDQQLAAAEQQLAARLTADSNAAAQAFQNVTWEQLQANPQLMQQYRQCEQILQQQAAQLQQIQQARGQAAHEYHHQQFEQAAAAQDDAFMRQHPELARDEAGFREIQKATLSYLKHKGLSEEEISLHWTGRKSFSLREALSQSVVLDAVRWHMSQAKAAEYRNGQRGRNLPPVIRPGVSQPASAGAHDEIRAVQKMLRTATGTDALRLGQRLMQLQREVGGGSE